MKYFKKIMFYYKFSQGYLINPGDMIKLGRIKLKINEIVLPGYEVKEKDNEKIDKKIESENNNKNKQEGKGIL